MFKRARWMTVMRLMRPWGHFGLIFTWGLIWVTLRDRRPSHVANRRRCTLAATQLFRMLITWMIGVWGMKQRGIWSKMPLIPLWDAIAFGIWIASFSRRTIRWRGVDYFLREGKLVPAHPPRG